MPIDLLLGYSVLVYTYKRSVLKVCCAGGGQEQKWIGRQKLEGTRQAKSVQRNTEARSRKHCCRKKVVRLTYFCVCVCMCTRECVCGSGCTGTGVCLRARSLTTLARNAPPYSHLRPLSLHHIFRRYLINGTIC